MQPPDSSVVPGKCLRVRDGRGVHRILKAKSPSCLIMRWTTRGLPHSSANPSFSPNSRRTSKQKCDALYYSFV